MITVPCTNCGSPVSRFPSDIARRKPYCTRACYRVHKGTGGIDANGYLVRTIDGKKIKEHRLVLEKALGRKLSTSEHVHHINGDTLDNSLKNLRVLSLSEHTREHFPLTWSIEAVQTALAEGRSLRSIAKEIGIWPNAIVCAFRSRGLR